MIWLCLIVLATYTRNIFNKGISDDISVLSELKKNNFAIKWKEGFSNPFHLLHEITWKVCKDRHWLQHLISIFWFSVLVCLMYLTLCKFFPQNVSFLASTLFAVHPCNAQIAGWTSGRTYCLVMILGLVAILTNSILPYLFTFFSISSIIPLPLFLDIPLWIKGLSIITALVIFFKTLDHKAGGARLDVEFKKDNLILYPRKAIVCLKSFCYYFTLAFFPTKMGWFHEMGEPIDDKLKSFNFHAVLCLLLIGTLSLFIGTKAFLGLIIFGIFILPFSNILTPGLFTSERYMTPALIGWSIFLAHLTVSYPYVAMFFITAYFMRTQLELWAYRDDFTLALHSLLNFNNSGFAWSNLVNIFLNNFQPAAAFDAIREGLKKSPNFPTLYYQSYLIHKATDLLYDWDKALMYLEKACHYGRHDVWFKELEMFRHELKRVRIEAFKRGVNEFDQKQALKGIERQLNEQTKVLNDTRNKAISQS